MIASGDDSTLGHLPVWLAVVLFIAFVIAAFFILRPIVRHHRERRDEWRNW